MNNRKIIMILSTVMAVVALTITLTVYLPKLSFYYLMNVSYSIDNNPKLYVVPTSYRYIEFPEGMPTEAVNYNGYSFTSPWGLVNSIESINDGPTMMEFGSGNDKILLSIKGPSDFDIREYLRMADEKYGDSSTMINEYYTTEFYDSCYAFMYMVLETTPEDIKSASSTIEEKAKLGLVYIKDYLGVDLMNEGITQIQVNTFSGFQYGVPGESSRVYIQLFEEDHSEIQFIIEGDITQEEIDVILVSWNN